MALETITVVESGVSVITITDETAERIAVTTLEPAVSLQITTAGEVNTGRNLGSGHQLFAGKTGPFLDFRTVIAGAGISAMTTDTEITLAIDGSEFTTDIVPEGSTNLYWTTDRFDTRLATKSTTDIAEGSNLYYTPARFDTRLATKTTTDLSEGTNLYYTPGRFDSRLATKTTGDLAEGANLYYTDARVGSYLTANSYATESYVGTQIADLIDSAPAALDTLNELAAALGDDANFSSTVTLAIGNKVDRTTTVNGHALSGNVSVTAGDVGLGDVDNTSDADKPVSAAQQTALDLKEDTDIINNDNVPNIFVGGKRRAWTRGLTAFTGMIAIEITGLYNLSNMNGMMNVHILEVSTTLQARILTISGQWNNNTSQWDYGFAVDNNSLIPMNIRFARDTVNSKVYVLLGDVGATWNNTRISIEVPLSSYNTNLNLGFNITSLNSLTGLAVDFTKAITLKADQNTTYTKTETDSAIALAIDALVDGAPPALNTLNELAAAVGDDANFSTTISTLIGLKLDTSDFTSTANSWLATRTTDDLAEGTTNKYYSTTLANSDIDARVTGSFIEAINFSADGGTY